MMQPKAIYNEIGPGQWVRDQILLHNPEFKVQDLDGNGTAGDIDDFILYYERNRTQLEKSIPFFRMAAAMDPGNMSVLNPIHDYLSLSSNMVPLDQIAEIYNLLGQLIIGARIYTNPYMKAADAFEFIHDELEKENRHFNSFDTSLMLIGTAHQLDLAVSEEPDLNNVFLSYRDGMTEGRDPYELLGDFYVDHGKTLESRGNLLEAGEYYDTAVALTPANAAYHRHLGRIFMKLEELKEAIVSFNKAVDLQPQDADGYNARGEAWFEFKQYPLALMDFQQALQLDPSSSRAHANLGRLYHVIGYKKKAFLFLDMAIELDSQSSSAYFYRARAKHAQGRLIAALRDYRRALRLNGRLSDAYYYIGKIYFRIAERKDSDWYYKRSRYYYSRAIKSDWQNAKTAYFIDLGMAHHKLGEFKKAERILDEAIKRDPDNTAAWIERGILHHLRTDKKRDYLKALADFDAAIRIDPKNIRAYTYRALLYLDLKQKDKAFDDYQKISELEPKNADALFNLGLIHKDKNQDIEALKALTKAIDIDPKAAKADYHYHRGLIWFKLEKFNKAFDDFDAAIKKDAKHAKAYYYRSTIWKMWRQYAKANADFALACQYDKTLCLARTPPDNPSSATEPDK